MVHGCRLFYGKSHLFPAFKSFRPCSEYFKLSFLKFLVRIIVLLSNFPQIGNTVYIDSMGNLARYRIFVQEINEIKTNINWKNIF